MTEVPNDSVLFHHLDATCVENMRSVYEDPSLPHPFRASMLLACAVAGADEAAPRARAQAHPEASLLEAQLLTMKLMQEDLRTLERAILQERMRPDSSNE